MDHLSVQFWTCNFLARFHSQTVAKHHSNKDLLAMSNGISQWPPQGRGKGIDCGGCVLILKINPSKHWCCGVSGSPLPAPATALGIWLEKNRFQLSRLTWSLLTTPSLAVLHLPASPCPPVPQGGILGMSYSKAPADTSQNMRTSSSFLFIASVAI